MTLLSIAGLCTFALIVWLLWLEHCEERNALAHSRNGDRFSTEDEVRGGSVHRERSTGQNFAKSRVEVGNGY
jgi:hypothetical protein